MRSSSSCLSSISSFTFSLSIICLLMASFCAASCRIFSSIFFFLYASSLRFSSALFFLAASSLRFFSAFFFFIFSSSFFLFFLYISRRFRSSSCCQGFRRMTDASFFSTSRIRFRRASI